MSSGKNFSSEAKALFELPFSFVSATGAGKRPGIVPGVYFLSFSAAAAGNAPKRPASEKL